MTVTLNPTITVSVSGPVGSGKSFILARTEEIIKQEFGNTVIVDAAVVEDERIRLTNELLQELILTELRRLTGQPTKCFSAPKYGKQEHLPVNTIPVNQPPRFFDEYILTPENKAEHEEIKAALFREIRKIAEMQLGGGLDRVMARGEWASLFERVSPELLPLALAIGIMQTADKPHLRSLNT
ncbi:hypothetical protein F1B47_14355 [Escherichia coli]|uniref:hypothetical protein n=1 Tax=Escherichia coli TaxID=562 RepID=UPI000BE4F504|nr:hypothetical protein [Escherichia coli]EFD7699321.1 hypothetical protein [Escherichia coli]EFD7709050.1 hypothetical protein [Escherichia coli]EFD9268820.1 hypothetical protein [Escherichia coli]EFE1252450.1 hypothetical protein [Escherichia coli]EFE6105213.1 hypothetical protein [Escherichia coli]